MILHRLPGDFTVCQVRDAREVRLDRDYCFIGKTDEELSLLCPTEDTPPSVLRREDGWKGFRIQGELDFSLTGILSRLAGVLAENKIGIFAVSTFNTDYIFVKKENFDRALLALQQAGYTLEQGDALSGNG